MCTVLLEALGFVLARLKEKFVKTETKKVAFLRIWFEIFILSEDICQQFREEEYFSHCCVCS